MPQSTLRLHHHPLSGHSHRVRLLLSILSLKTELVEIDMKSGAHKAPEFLKLNPLGQVPVLEDGELVVRDSNAIMVYLATKYDQSRKWYPATAEGAAEVQKWLSIAAGQLASGPNAARLVNVFKLPLDKAAAQRIAANLLAVMENELTSRPFLTGASPTIADVALYAYTARAPEGDISLAEYPAVRRWIERVEALPHFVPMPKAA